MTWDLIRHDLHEETLLGNEEGSGTETVITSVATLSNAVFEGPHEDQASSRTRFETSSEQAEHLIGGPYGLAQNPATVRDYIHTHGYIARTFGARAAAEYFTRLFRVDECSLQPILSQEWPGAFFITNTAMRDTHPSIPIANRPARPIDHVLRDYGTVVPQHIWYPSHSSDAQRYTDVALNMPIFLVHNDRRTVGLSLINVASGDCTALLNARATAPVGNAHTIAIRIKVSISVNDHSIDIEQMLSASSGLATANGINILC